MHDIVVEQSKQLTQVEKDELWEDLGGDRVYLEYRLSQLLCRYRSSVILGCEDERLRSFLQKQWTLKGPCFAGRFKKMKCPSEVRELHKCMY